MISGYPGVKTFVPKPDARSQLLICDCHKSHEAYRTFEPARENNIHILALSPHTTHRLQPLDKGVFGPLSCYYNEACTEYLSLQALCTQSTNGLSQNC